MRLKIFVGKGLHTDGFKFFFLRDFTDGAIVDDINGGSSAGEVFA